MNFPDDLLPELWYWGAFAPVLLAVLWSLRGAGLKSLLAEPWTQNQWLGAIVVLMLIWSLRAGVRPGLNLHLLGAAAMQLMFGPELAILGLSAVLAAVTFNSHLSWQAFGLNALVMILAPVLFSRLHLRCVERFLPANFFIYIFVGSFLGAALSLVFTGVVASSVLFVAGAYSAEYLLGNYLPYFILLAFSEAFLTGLSITLMAVYRPEWLRTFDDARYLWRK